ncbi:uncharacterized protein SCHCODRAFT_02508618 [Schizophyllum commune H4-8]|nr:uncharacterized protein SCHCODRAFT_02508618 [Schizophyllum commune H4-8]KAI5890042.1 hypothetical protein SCHCODRAFT_02508618 [Schizophyllum commune H4-8]
MDNAFAAQQETISICATCKHEVSCPITDVPLASDHVPSPSEAQAMETCIEEIRTQLAKLQHVKRTVEQTLNSLSAMESKLENALATQRAYVAPVRRMPVELLEIVFELSCAGATLSPPDCTPLALSAVCRHWRQLALCMPRIWADVQLTNVPLNDWSTRHAVIRRMKHCLRLTNGFPLTQPIHPRSGTGGAGLNVLVKYTNQWQHLRIDGPHEELDPRVQASLSVFGSKSYTRLHTLDLDMIALFASFSLRVFSDLPALRTLVVRNPKHVAEPAIPTHNGLLPLGQLQELRTVTTTRFAFQLLSRCLHLLSWTHTDDSASHRFPTAGVVMLPRLRSLRADYKNARCSIDLNFLLAPSLESLKLSWRDNRLSDSAPAFILLQSSQHTLRELELDNPPSNLRHDLVMLNHVHSLALHFPSADPLTDNILAAFMARNENGALSFLPLLEDLELGGHGRYRGQAVVDMVNARHAAGRPFKMLDLDLFNVDMDHFGDLDALARLRQLVPEFVGSE